MKKIIPIIVCLLLCCSCAKQPTKAPAKPQSAGYDFSAQYIRLFQTEASSGEIKGSVLTVGSRAELLEYGNGSFDKDFDTLEYSDGQASFNTLTQKYTDEFFKTNQLIICTLTEPSGSNRHKVLSLSDEKVEIERIIPESGTDDMASWAIIVESEIFDTSELNMYVDGKNKTGTPADVTAYGGVTSLSIHIPKGWEYEVKNIDGEYKEYGIYFHPKGEAGRLYLNYQTALGLCGTGLETDRITVAGYECDKLTWDGKPVWDMIDFNVDFGSVNVRNDNATWLAARYDEAMQILDSIKIKGPSMTAKRAEQLAIAEYNAEYDLCRSYYNIIDDTFSVSLLRTGKTSYYTAYSNETVKLQEIIQS